MNTRNLKQQVRVLGRTIGYAERVGTHNDAMPTESKTYRSTEQAAQAWTIADAARAERTSIKAGLAAIR